MEVYVTEQEQLEGMRRFLREYRMALIGGVVLALGGFFGFQAWQTQKLNQSEAASMEYLGMSENLMQGQLDAAEKHASRIVGQYADSPYAALASLVLAKVKVEKGDLPAAHAHLKWAVDNASDPAVKQLAKLRLARVLYNQNQYDKALSALNDTTLTIYASSVQELRGDVYLAMKKPADARKAYAEALAKLNDRGSARKALLQMKLDDLGVATQAEGKAG